MGWQQILEMTPHAGAHGAVLGAWYAELLARHPQAAPLELAILGGYQAATPGLAFLAGYQAALRALWPEAPDSLGAFCVTEQRSLRAADMRSRLGEDGLSGRKDFVTGGAAACWLLVSARVEAEGESPRLAMLQVDSDACGVVLEPGPALPLLPDIPHARVLFNAAPARQLAGDGWTDYVKPFRSLEDLHVMAAICAWAYGAGVRLQWQQALRLRLLAVLAGCAGVAGNALHSATGHLALAAVSDSFAALRGELDQAFAAGPTDLAQQWQRDQRVLDLAQGARQARLAKSLTALGLATADVGTMVRSAGHERL
jgi:alkylation response protein AidB-like acyl-CoA dehydrogenase